MATEGVQDELIRSLIEHINDIPYIATPTGDLLYFGEQCARFGYRSEEVIARGVMAYIHPDDRERVAGELVRGIESGEVFPTEFRILSASGEVHWLEDLGQLVFDADGNVTGMAGVLHEVTHRKLAEEALRESEERFRLVFEQGAFAMAMSDEQFRFYKVNTTFCSMLGYSEEEFAHLTFRDITHPDHLEADTANVERLVRGEIPVYKTEKRYVTKSGETLWGRLTLSVLRDSSGAFLHILAMIEDIDERRKAKQALQNAQRFESLAFLAGGIAHDFNNLLVGILGNIDLAKAALPGRNQQAARHLEQAISISSRASALTQQLLTFTKGGAPALAPVSLGDLVDSVARFALSGSDLGCTVSIPDDLWACDADETQLARALENLLINARQAMPMGGTLGVVARNVPGAEVVPPLEPGRYVALSVTDQGTGIPEEVLAHIFDPFFTTKAAGSGLGLATALSIVKRHGGHIDVRSIVGEGSTFTVYLPASLCPRASEQVAREAPEGNGELSILVMDDEPTVRAIVTDMLDSGGHHVETVEGGEAALVAWHEARARGRPYDIVLLDLTIPGGMGGAQVVSELRALDPSLRAIASSGYSDDPIMVNPRRFGFCASLPKPYLTRDLLRVVETVWNDFGQEPPGVG